MPLDIVAERDDVDDDWTRLLDYDPLPQKWTLVVGNGRRARVGMGLWDILPPIRTGPEGEVSDFTTSIRFTTLGPGSVKVRLIDDGPNGSAKLMRGHVGAGDLPTFDDPPAPPPPSPWKPMPGSAKRIAASNDNVWAIGTDTEFGGFGIHQWTGSEWHKVDGGATSIAVTSDGIPWVSNDKNQIFRRAPEGWLPLPGSATSISAFGDAVWITGTDVESGGFGLHRWNGTTWEKIDGGAISVAVTSNGIPWVCNDKNEIFRRISRRWEKLPGTATSISAFGDAVWITGTDVESGGFGIFKWTGTTWKKLQGGAVQIAVGARVWVANDSAQIFKSLFRA